MESRIRRSLAGTVLASIGTMALAACQQSGDGTGAQATVAATEVITTDQGLQAKPGVSVTNARLTLPAVRGNPAAAYFTLSNSESAPATLAAVHVEGAERAEMHETIGGKMSSLTTIEVPANGTVAFEPGGKHVMAFNLAASLVAGGSTEMTLSFADGDKISVPLTIGAPGSGDAPHGTGHD